jgi:5-(aminomethyl)-3-furanmethanol phosphate kinase
MADHLGDTRGASKSGSLSVIKVGGSLLDWPELPARLVVFLDRYRDQEPEPGRHVVLMAGGGQAADVVRLLDRTIDLGDVRAHRLAIRALDWTAELLGALLPDGRVVRRPEAFRSVWNCRRLPILAPAHLLEEIDRRGPDPLPASWDLTSDSIAARIAVHLRASRLILLKSRSLPQGAGIDEAARIGLVDPLLPRMARGLEVVATVCLRDSEPSMRVLAPDRPEH